MYFFVDTIINEKKSGIEYAIMRRLELFKMHQQAAKILTVNYDRMVASTLADDGLLADVINLFDYFQGVLDQSITPVKLTDLNLPAHSLLEEVEPNLYHVMLNHKEIQRIHLFPRKQKQIDYIEYLSTEGVVYQKDFYDVRGFLSKRNHFDIDNNWLTYEQWLNLDGQVVLECYYQIDPSNTVDKAIYQLTDNNGCVHFFDGEQAYIRYFFDTINAQFGHKNTFIFDRLFEITWAANHMQTEHSAVGIFHSSHLVDSTDVQHSLLNNYFIHMVKNPRKYDYLISATELQRQDVLARYPDANVITIPVSYVPDEALNAPRIAMNNRQRHTLIFAARLAFEKQQVNVVKAMQQVIKVIPDATAEFWGYANGDYGEKVKATIKELNLTEHVFIKGYTPDVAPKMDQVGLATLTSTMEGFSLSLLEAQAHGLPQVVTDVKYGPKSLIIDGENGFRVPNDDIDALATKIITIMQDSALQDQMSQAAYANAQNYSAANVWHQWEPLVTTCNAYHNN
ncbi:glycosyltransferase [Periweissella beninensis]|uniref:glycosyltransferase n=1 Tax=Periweissella beninensis TaxID=504936 RepID=UPI0021A76918|nr:glycosyltransferase [Periweissella beninensis]